MLTKDFSCKQNSVLQGVKHLDYHIPPTPQKHLFGKFVLLCVPRYADSWNLSNIENHLLSFSLEINVALVSSEPQVTT